MKYIKTLIALIFCSLTFANNIDVSVDQKEVVLGSSFVLTVKFEHTGDQEPYVSFDPKNAEVIDDNSQDNSRINIQGYFAGGKIIQKKIYVFKYVLQPVNQGYVHIRNIKVDLGHKVVRQRSIQVKVLSKARRLPDYVFKAEVDKEDVYVGEAINLNYYLYFKGGVASRPDILKFPKLKNFLKRFELPKGGVEQVALQGKRYQRLLLYKAIVYPQKEGSLTIDPMSISFQHLDRRVQNRDVFGLSMTFSRGQYKTKKMNSKRVKLEVKPIPVQNMPKNFTGLVGKHDFKLTLNKDKVLVNDILEARLEVTGEGALERLDPPKLIQDESFEEFEAKTEIVELGSLKNKKVVDYTFLAKRSTKLDPKIIKLSYFDPETRQFVEKELSLPAIQIFGSGVKSEVLSKDRSQTEPSQSEGKKNVDGLELVSPLFAEDIKVKALNIRYINIALFGLILLILISGVRFSIGRPVKGNLGEVKKNLCYKTVHDFVVENCEDGLTLREKVEKASISNDAKKYFLDLLDKAEKNEYKGKSFKLSFNKKYFIELLDA